MLVDDDAAVRSAVSGALAGEGYDVDCLGDAEEALRQALAAPPSLVLLDVSMPVLDGWELCEILRRQSQTREVPVLFITGRTDVRDRITAMQVGGTGLHQQAVPRERPARQGARARRPRHRRCHWEAVGPRYARDT
jgi:DNA-binding response OmpR family regulator